MSGNVQIVHANGLAHFFKIAADRAVVLCCFGRVGQHLQKASKLFDHLRVLRHIGAFFSPVVQL